jgi:hypothetical protein
LGTQISRSLQNRVAAAPHQIRERDVVQEIEDFVAESIP